MRHAIDPKIDCVFKALLGSEENRNLLIHFLRKRSLTPYPRKQRLQRFVFLLRYHIIGMMCLKSVSSPILLTLS